MGPVPSFTESRRKGPARDPFLQLLVVRMEADRTLEQQLLLLSMARIGDAALDGADRLASLVVVETDALGAELRVNDVESRHPR